MCEPGARISCGRAKSPFYILCRLNLRAKAPCIGKGAIHKMVSVDRNMCTGCGVCERVCPADVFTVSGGKASVGRGENCIRCGNCEVCCPAGCILLGE